ncbi:MAG TPA: hypothetical protein PK264_13695 [Hyphomicrobiaceae bacterium]|nr:hypothetical protein [Hyphomicrobiaceae bacterium]
MPKRLVSDRRISRIELDWKGGWARQSCPPEAVSVFVVTRPELCRAVATNSSDQQAVVHGTGLIEVRAWPRSGNPETLFRGNISFNLGQMVGAQGQSVSGQARAFVTQITAKLEDFLLRHAAASHKIDLQNQIVLTAGLIAAAAFGLFLYLTSKGSAEGDGGRILRKLLFSLAIGATSAAIAAHLGHGEDLKVAAVSVGAFMVTLVVSAAF